MPTPPDSAVTTHLPRSVWGMHLSRTELRLVDSVVNGQELDLRRRFRRNIRSSVIRDIAQGRLAPNADPLGIRLTGAVIEEPLNLELMQSTLPISFDSCLFAQGINARRARLHSLNLFDCTVTGPHDGSPAIQCEEAVFIDGVRLDDITVSARSEAGAIRFSRAQIGGHLILIGGTVDNQYGPAFSATHMRVSGDLRLDDGRFIGSGESGAILIRGSELGSQVILSNARVVNVGGGPALAAGRAQVAGQVIVKDTELFGIKSGDAVEFHDAKLGELVLQDTSLVGAISLASARVDEHLSVRKVKVDISGQVVLDAKQATVGADVTVGNLDLGDSTFNCLLDFAEATVLGSILLVATQALGLTGSALDASGLTCRGRLVISSDFTAEGCCTDALIELVSARLGYLHAECAVRNSGGPAINATNLQVTDSVQITGVDLGAVSKWGALRLTDAEIAGTLRIVERAKFVNNAGPGVSADGLRVGGYAEITSVEIRGAGRAGALRMIDARFGSQLSLGAGTIVCNDTGPAFLGQAMHVEQDLSLDGLSASGAGDTATFDLSAAQIGRRLVWSNLDVENTDFDNGTFAIDGMTYAGAPAGVSIDDWLYLLRHRCPAYMPRAYRQLAAAAQTSGHDDEARRVLIAQRNDQLKRATEKRSSRIWGWLVGVMLGHGYRAGRALAALALLVILSACVTATTALGRQGLMAFVPAGTPRTACSATDRALVGVDFSLPLVKTGVGERCLVDTHTASGRTLSIVGPFIQLLAWFLSTLFIAGFTSLIRRP